MVSRNFRSDYRIRSITMNSLGTILVLLITVISGGRGATRVYFSKCAQKGFTCITNANKKLDITYECPTGAVDIALYINQFSAPTNTESLQIRNCQTLAISTRCSGENKPIQKLQVNNIKHLVIQRWQYEPMLPPTVIFENISRIDVIPTRTFGQINKAFYTLSCTYQTNDFQNVYFRNVTIDIVQSNAFVGLNQFKNFSFVNVNINRIQTGGIQLRHDLQGAFEMRNCVIEVVEDLGIQIYGKRSIFSDNNFTEVFPNGINGSMEDFYFTKNVVGTLQPYALSVLATNVFVLDNDFLHLKGSALEKISPGLIQESGRNFGKLKFVYDFSKNSLNFLDAGSLHPDYLSYENVQTEMMFSRNKMLCSCENLGWLFSSLGHGPNTAQLETFYEMVLDPAYGNICAKSYGQPCDLPLKLLKQMTGNGKCLANVTLEILCDKFLNVEDHQVTVEVSLDVSEEVPEDLLNPMNYTDVSMASHDGKETLILLIELSILYILLLSL